MKTRIRSAQMRAAVAVNSELVLLYWSLGKRILIAQSAQGYGKKIVPQLSVHLSRAFPDMKGFSPRNLDYMLAFARARPDQEVLQPVLTRPLRGFIQLGLICHEEPISVLPSPSICISTGDFTLVKGGNCLLYPS